MDEDDVLGMGAAVREIVKLAQAAGTSIETIGDAIFFLDSTGKHIDITSVVERHGPAPKRITRTIHLLSWPSFVAAVARYRDQGPTMIYCDGQSWTAVFDDVADKPSWRTFRARFCPEFSDELKVWKSLGDALSQDEFAAQVERLVHTIVGKDSTTFMRAVLEFDAQKTTVFKSHKRLDNGEVKFVYDETIAEGGVTLPREFTIRVPLYRWDSETFDLQARLRYRLHSSGLKLWVELPTLEQQIMASVEQRMNALASNGMFVVHGVPD